MKAEILGEVLIAIVGKLSLRIGLARKLSRAEERIVELERKVSELDDKIRLAILD